MKILLNGEEITTEVKTLAELINEYKINTQVMAAAVNMNIVKQADWDSYKLNDDDKVELLRFVGGG